MSIGRNPRAPTKSAVALTIADIVGKAANASNDGVCAQQPSNDAVAPKQSSVRKDAASVKPFKVQFYQSRALIENAYAKPTVWRPEDFFRLLSFRQLHPRARKRIVESIKESDIFKLDNLLDTNAGQDARSLYFRDYLMLGGESDEKTSSACLGKKLQRLAAFALKSGGDQSHASDLAATAWVIGHHWGHIAAYIREVGEASKTIEARRKNTGTVRRKATEPLKAYFEYEYLALKAKRPEWKIQQIVEELVEKVKQYGRKSEIRLFQTTQSERPYLVMRSWATEIEKRRNPKRADTRKRTKKIKTQRLSKILVPNI
jgi:hypothetical protein